MTSTKPQGLALATLILLATAAIAIIQSNHRIFEPDELYGFFTAAEPSVQAILHTQATNPISLDPPTYHLLAHAALAVSGHIAPGIAAMAQTKNDELAARAPSIAGFLLMQLCLFFLARRLILQTGTSAAVSLAEQAAANAAGWLAMLLPLATHTFFYAPHGRPYGLLLGLYAASLLAYFKATETTTHPQIEPGWTTRAPFIASPTAMSGSQRKRQRALPLLALTATIALAITSHFFGLLILVPIAAAELIRTVTRRRLDWPMLLSLAAGMASVLFILPTQHAVMIYKLHYYSLAPNLRAITIAYRRIFIEYPASWSTHVQTALLIALIFAITAILFAARSQLIRPQDGLAGQPRLRLPVYEFAAIGTLAYLPVFGWLLGRFVTHSFETRYVNPAVIALTLLTIVALRPLLLKRRTALAIVAAVTCFTLLIRIEGIRRDTAERNSFLAGYTAPCPIVGSAPGAVCGFATTAATEKPATTEPIYLNDMGIFIQHWYYAAPALRARLTYVYGQQQEIDYLRHDVHYLTAIDMQRFTPVRVLAYPDYLAAAGPAHPAQTVLYRTSWEWLARDLEARHATLQPQGTYLGGTLTAVQ